MRKTLIPMVLAVSALGACQQAPALDLVAGPGQVLAAADDGARAAGRATEVCDGLWMRLLEPNEVPWCADLDEWHACFMVENHDPAQVRFEVTPLPPTPQAPPSLAPAPKVHPNIVVVTAAEHYELGALFWIHGYPSGSKPPDCSDVHVGFPFYHGSGQ